MNCFAYEFINANDPFSISGMCSYGPFTCFLIFLPSVFSTLGTFFAILCYIVIRPLRSSTTMKYLIHICTLEFLTSILSFYYLSDSIYDSPVGKIIADILEYGAITTMVWIFWMALEFKRVAFNYGLSEEEQVPPPGRTRSLLQIVIAYTVPILVVLLYVLNVERGEKNAVYSFYSYSYNGTIMLLICFILYTYVRCAAHLKLIQPTLTILDTFKDLIVYPLILVVCWVPNVAFDFTFLFESVCHEESDTIPINFAIWVLIMIILARIQGFLNAWAYLRTRSVWQEIRAYYRYFRNRGLMHPLALCGSS